MMSRPSKDSLRTSLLTSARPTLTVVLLICAVIPSCLSQSVEKFSIRSDIKYRFATTQVCSTIRNDKDEAQEIVFDVRLPKEAFITSFSMEMDGKVYDGEVKEKAEAKKQYQEAVSRGQSAGHIKQTPRHSNKFDVSINVANHSSVTFTLLYQELLRRTLGTYKHEVNVDPGQAVEDFSIEVYILENSPITTLKVPALRTDEILNNVVAEDNTLAVIDRPTSESAYIMFKPSMKDQGEDGISAKFSVHYDVEHNTNGEVLVADGYFLHFFAPASDIPMPKDIIFVLDVSGSMSGRKIEQVKTAMNTILSDLEEVDRFNVIKFSSGVTRWRSNMVHADKEAVMEANAFTSDMVAEGMTNIKDALVSAVTDLKEYKSETRVSMVFFLTDGDPTEGETNLDRIAAAVRESNGGTATIFSLSFGDGADFAFLKRISAQNDGFARKIYEAADASLQVSSLYEEISTVLMKNINIRYLPSSVKNETVTMTTFPVICAFSEVVVAGRINEGSEKFGFEIEGIQAAGDVNLILPEEDIDNLIPNNEGMNPFFSIKRDFSSITEKVWAFLTIKQLLKEMDKTASDEIKTKAIKDEILRLSLKYKFVTPLTSMVVTKPEDNDEKKVTSSVEDPDIRSQATPYGSRPAVLPPSGTLWDPAGAYGSPGLASGIRRHSSSYNHHGIASYPTGLKVAATHTYHMMRTTPRQTTTRRPKMTTTRRRPGRKGGKQPKVVAAMLDVAVINDDQKTVCMVPKRKITPGNYTVFTSRNGVEISLETTCLKKCRSLLARKVVMKGPDGESSASLELPVRAPVSQNMTLSSSGVTVVIRQQQPRRRQPVFTMSIHVTDARMKVTGGAFGIWLRTSTKKLNRLNKKKAQDVCRGSVPAMDYAVFLKAKQMRRYISNN